MILQLAFVLTAIIIGARLGLSLIHISLQKSISKYGEILIAPVLIFVGVFMLFGDRLNLPKDVYKRQLLSTERQSVVTIHPDCVLQCHNGFHDDTSVSYTHLNQRPRGYKSRALAN